MAVVDCKYGKVFVSYVKGSRISPLFLVGDALGILRELPEASIDFCMTSPPYWGHRDYGNNGIGLEADYRDYISHLAAVFAEVKRILRPTGSLWLNIGDVYVGKRLLGLPWRVAITLADSQGWVPRNSVAWNKVKGGPDNTKDRLRTVHEGEFLGRDDLFVYSSTDGVSWSLLARRGIPLNAFVNIAARSDQSVIAAVVGTAKYEVHRFSGGSWTELNAQAIFGQTPKVQQFALISTGRPAT